LKSLRRFQLPIKLPQLQRDLVTFERFLSRNASFAETDALRLFRPRPGLLRLLAGCFPEVSQRPDLYASELNLAGEFRTDFALGNSRYRALALVEFESGDNSGLLLPSKVRTLSNRTGRGLSQLLQWGELLDDLGRAKFVERIFTFSPETISFMYVGGRTSTLSEVNLGFSSWLQRGLTISNHAVSIMTFDALGHEMREHLAALELTIP